ncbi:hypothetical protein VPH35_021009 [Triticum aestivum]
MEAMSASISRLCQMVHDVGLRPGTKEHLQVVLEAARARGCLDDNFVSLFNEVLVGFLDKFTIVKKLADDLDNVDLEVALAAQRLVQQDTIDIFTHVYAQIVLKDYYMQEQDDRTLAFLDRRATLDGIVQKHVELAANAAAPHTSVGDSVH